jgi:hypothetical protein
MTDEYTIKFTAQGLAYVRQVLGTRPFDEVGALILNIERQKGEQEGPPLEMPVAAPSVRAPRSPRASRPNGAEPVNGSAAPL